MLLWAGAAGAAPDPVWHITQGEWQPSAGDSIPATGWQPITLPRLCAIAHPKATGVGRCWYRLHLLLPQAPSRPVGLYLGSMNRSARLYVNGVPLTTLGSFTDPMPLNWNRPQFVSIAPSLLHAGDNRIDAQLRYYDYERAWIASVRVGDEVTLREAYQTQVFWQNDSVMILAGVMVCAALFVLAVWAGRREPMFLWFGLALLVWSFICQDYFADYPPFQGLMWERVLDIAQVLRALLVDLFVLSRVGRRAPRLAAALWLYWAVGTVALLTWVRSLNYVEEWYLGAVLAGLYFIVLLVRDAWRHRVSEGVLLACAAGASFVLYSYDLYLYQRATWTDLPYLGHFGAPLFLGAVAWALMRRGVEAMQAQEVATVVLEQRVAAKGAEVEQRMAELIEARRSEAVALERSRLMSEMHDGVGSQLTTALAVVEREPGSQGVARILRESIEDLQLIIDSLEPVGGDLLTTLGMLRYRVQRRLQQSGIGIEWQVRDLPPLPSLTPHSVLSILRVLQEAFANVIKHAGASRVTVSTALEGSGAHEVACICIADNGCGIRSTGQGRGMISMRRRAHALGGSLTIDSGATGTALTLRIPTGRAPAV